MTVKDITQFSMTLHACSVNIYRYKIILQQVFHQLCAVFWFLQNRGRQELLDGITLGVPAFHIYGHGAKCQVDCFHYGNKTKLILFQLSYSPRILKNCGLTDGEATERLWSYLRRLSKMTKEMRPSHRIDVLTACLLHYGAKASH